MTAPTTIEEITARNMDIALREPFGIATGAQALAANLLVHVRLRSGAEGWGEAAPFAAVNGETREAAREAIAQVVPGLRGTDARTWRTLGARLRAQIPHAMSACCAIETAVLDALTRHYEMPLWVLFGGAGSVLQTDCTITTGSAEAAQTAAARIARAGFETIKLKVGGVPLADDVARVEAVVATASGCGLLLDANGAMASVDEALDLLEAARRAGGRVVLFEQPLGREDFDGMSEVAARAGVPVAADESVASVADVLRVAHAHAAHVINLKIMKSGIVQALEMAAAARAHGLGLMIGGMVESELAMTTSACLAAGQGGFDFVDLDTPLFLLDSPLAGGSVVRGPRLDLSDIVAGHGVAPRERWLTG